MEIRSWRNIEDAMRIVVSRWADKEIHGERGETQAFWTEILAAFGVDRRRDGVFFEKHHKGAGFSDVFWSGKLLVEQKARGKGTKAAAVQATKYVKDMDFEDMPYYVVACDFDNFEVLIPTTQQVIKFPLTELVDNVKLFGVLAGRDPRLSESEEGVNQTAAKEISEVYKALLAEDVSSDEAAQLMVWLVYSMFAEDAGITERGAFTTYLMDQSSDQLGSMLKRWFVALDTPVSERKVKNKVLLDLPYINGGLFSGVRDIEFPEFDDTVRQSIIGAAEMDWRYINPEIFGSMFQGVMDPKTQHDLGAHYTSEKNILKVIEPLFLNDLEAEFEAVKGKQQLFDLHDKIKALTFLDPACGCGNFLVVTFRQVARLEHRILRAMIEGQYITRDQATDMLSVRPTAFKGIEISPFPARIAEVALWMTERLMDIEFMTMIGHEAPMHLPLPKGASMITCADSLSIDWDVTDYIIGNPPFLGFGNQNPEQKKALLRIVGSKTSMLDFVTAWFIKAADVIQGHPHTKASLVSTNSITQGTQRPTLMKLIGERGLGVSYTESFKWSNEAKGKQAGVHCVIATIGTSVTPEFTVTRRSTPISDLPQMRVGSLFADGGHLILSTKERDELITKYPVTEKWVRPLLGSKELINGGSRYVLWLTAISAAELKSIPPVMARIESVRTMRLESKKMATRKAANAPTEVLGNNQPTSRYLSIPRVSSENRDYIPMAFFSPDTVVSDTTVFVENAENWLFALLTSTMHMVWTKKNSGRLKSDFIYGAGMVYNTLPVPDLTDADKEKLNQLGQAILDARANHPESTLADLYSPLLIPADLRKAHDNNDKFVDALYGLKDGSKESRLAVLMDLYQKAVAK